MFETDSYTPSAHVVARPGSRAEAVAYVRKVYAILAVGALSAVAGGLLALYAGTPVPMGRLGAIPPAVAWGLEHPILSVLGYLVAFFAASFVRKVRGVNLLALLGYTFITGLFLAPAIYFAQFKASTGGTLSAAPVRDALLLTGAAFAGLTTYAFVSKRDFSFMRGALSMGLWVVIGASLIGIFLQSAVFHLAIASVGVLLFGGFILYDTSRMLHDSDRDDAVGDALSMFLNLINLFMSLLRILSASRR